MRQTYLFGCLNCFYEMHARLPQLFNYSRNRRVYFKKFQIIKCTGTYLAKGLYLESVGLMECCFPTSSYKQYAMDVYHKDFNFFLNAEEMFKHDKRLSKAS